MFQNIMMVCVGNICRSPIAEAYLQNLRPELNVFSSGLAALVGKPADQKSIELMHFKDIDLSSHLARQINSTLVSASDLVLTMEHSHVTAIHSKFPESRGKVHLIGKWNKNEEVPDPFRKDMEDFEIAAAMIESGLDDWCKKLWS